MTTDNKTLADVQPSPAGQGDGLLPCPFCGNSAEFVPYKNNGLTVKCKSMGCIQRHQRTLRYGIEWLRTSMTEHWNARALASRQPVEFERTVPTRRRESAVELLLTLGFVWNNQRWEDRRQPAGVPAAWMHTHKATGRVEFGLSPMYDCDFNAVQWDSVALYAAPAQAVDLGRWSQRHADDLHVAVHTALSVHAGSLSQKKRAAISAYVKRLLIDSQAVGNG